MIVDVTPTEITKESTPDEVQQWFQHHEGGLFESIYKDHFQGFSGKVLLGIKENQWNSKLSGFLADALWNALHPPDDDVEMGDATDVEMGEMVYNTYSTNVRGITRQKSTVTGYRDDNLDGDIFLTKREEKVTFLYNELCENKFVYVYGPPFTGKSSLATLFTERLDSFSERYVCFSMLDVSKSYGRDIDTYIQSKCDGNTLVSFIESSDSVCTIIIDEFQVLNDTSHPSHESFGSTLKRLKGYANCRMLVLSSYGVGKQGGLLPSAYTFPRRLSCTELFLSPEEVEILCDNFDARNCKGITLTRAARDFICTHTNGHIGYVSVLLNTLNKDTYDNVESHLKSNIVLSLLSEQRCSAYFYSSVYNDTLNQNDRNILKEIFYKGFIEANIDNQEHIEIIRKLSKLGLVVPTASNHLHFRLPTQVDRQIYLEKFLTHGTRTDDYLTDNLIEFMDQVVLQFDYDLVLSTFSKKKKLRSMRTIVYEAHWQKEFYRVVYSLTPYRCRVCPEVTNVEIDEYVYTTEKSSKLDFYINGEKQWQIELCADFSKLQEHIDRFDPDTGKYSTLPLRDYVVVHFEAKKEDICLKLKNGERVEIAEEGLIDHDHLLYVFYDFNEDYVVTAICKNGYLVRLNYSLPSQNIIDLDE